MSPRLLQLADLVDGRRRIGVRVLVIDWTVIGRRRPLHVAGPGSCATRAAGSPAGRSAVWSWTCLSASALA